jgi:RNA polymerase sigma factor (sigma-70 family)
MSNSKTSPSNPPPPPPRGNPTVENYLPMVRSVARGLLPGAQRADLDDLIQEGNVALMAAVRDYDPGRGAAFMTYAIPRVRNAIRNYLRDRREDVSRLTLQRVRRVEAASAEFGHDHGRPPTPEELVERVGGRAVADAAAYGGTGGLHDGIEDAGAEPPYRRAVAAEARAAIAARLAPWEFDAAVAYFIENRPKSEVARILHTRGYGRAVVVRGALFAAARSGRRQKVGEFARAAGLSVPTIRKIERLAEARVNWPTFERVARHLGMTTDELLRRTGGRPCAPRRRVESAIHMMLDRIVARLRADPALRAMAGVPFNASAAACPLAIRASMAGAGRRFTAKPIPAAPPEGPGRAAASKDATARTSEGKRARPGPAARPAQDGQASFSIVTPKPRTGGNPPREEVPRQLRIA